MAILVLWSEDVVFLYRDALWEEFEGLLARAGDGRVKEPMGCLASREAARSMIHLIHVPHGHRQGQIEDISTGCYIEGGVELDLLIREDSCPGQEDEGKEELLPSLGRRLAP